MVALASATTVGEVYGHCYNMFFLVEIKICLEAVENLKRNKTGESCCWCLVLWPCTERTQAALSQNQAGPVVFLLTKGLSADIS